jgi:tRNA threonylcarbamoyladenosine biosynthesis protein TsaB
MSNEPLKEKPLILAIETATRAGGVAIARGENVLAWAAGDPAVSHSANLITMIQDTLSSVAATLNDVDLFAVAVGPGSFTGLRIGLATVKAFAVHLNRKVVGVSTLAAVAHASGARGGIVSLLPAGRGEVFAQRFTVNDGGVIAADEAEHLSPASVREKYARLGALTLTGEGARMFEPSVVESVQADGTVTSDSTAPLVKSIAMLGFRAYQEGKTVTPDDLHAVYVRASDAEINERWQRQKQQQPVQS